MKYCTAEGYGLRQATKHQMSCFVLHVRNEFGSPCTCDQNVHAELRHCHSATLSQVKADVKLLHTPGDYEVGFTPQCTGDHELSVLVNGHTINGSPFNIFVDNLPDPQHCTASGPGIQSVKKDKSNVLSFHIKLADSENQQCVLSQNILVTIRATLSGQQIPAQNVSVTLTMRLTGQQIPVTVDQESASDYRVSYTPAVAGEMEVSVMVNGVHIKNSPWKIKVDNPPDHEKSTTSFSEMQTINKSKTQTFSADIYLKDSFNDPCVFEQTIFIAMENVSDLSFPVGTITPDIICKSPSHYQACFIPDKPGKWVVWVNVNGTTFMEPFEINIIDNVEDSEAPKHPDPQHCTVSGRGSITTKRTSGYLPATFMVHLADSDGEECTIAPENICVSVTKINTREKIPVTLDKRSFSLYQVSYGHTRAAYHNLTGEVEVSVMINGKHIKKSPWIIA